MNSPQLQILTTAKDTEVLFDYLSDKDFVALDTETTGVHMGAQVIGYSVCAEESKAYYVVLAAYDKESKRLNFLDTMTTAGKILGGLTTKNLIGHNYIFDAKMIEDNFKISTIQALHTDTMIAAHLLDENREIGLKELARQMFGESSIQEQQEMKASVLANGGIWKEGKNSIKEMFKADPEILGKYGAKDAWLTYKLFLEFVPQLVEQGLDKFFYEEESMPLLRGPTYQLNTSGMKLDIDKMKSLQKQLEAECIESEHLIMRDIQKHVKDKFPGDTKANTFKITSSQNLSWLLFEKLGLEFNILTNGGKEILKYFSIKHCYTRTNQRDFINACKSQLGQNYTPDAIVNGKLKKGKKIKNFWAYTKCDKKVLEKFSSKYEWIKLLLKYQSNKKLINTYCEGMLERVQYGIIRPSFLQHGTVTGRYASKAPNFQNLPRREKRIKACIISRPGKVFVGADYSQLEPRVFAFFSGDERLKKAFVGDDDFYSVIGAETYDKYDCLTTKQDVPNSFKNMYVELRDNTKVFTLSATYGTTAFKLAPALNKSTEEAQADIDKYFEKFPKVKEMQLKAHENIKKNGYVTNYFGRKRRMPEAKKIPKIYGNKTHSELPYEVRNVLNTAVNFPIQATGSSIVNRASITFWNNCRKSCIYTNIVLQVHDSLVVECNEEDAENVAILLQDAMETAIQLEGVRLEAVPRIGKNLSEI